MAGNSDLALVGANGVIGVANPGATAPTDATTAWPAAFKDLGWVSDDGLTEAFDESKTSFKPWGSTAPIKTIVTASTKTFRMTFWETNPDVLGLYFRNGGPVTVGANGTISFAEKVSLVEDKRALVFDTFEGDNLMRIYVPEVSISDRGNLVYKSDSMIGYDVTMTAYPGDDNVIAHRFYSIPGLSA